MQPFALHARTSSDDALPSSSFTTPPPSLPCWLSTPFYSCLASALPLQASHTHCNISCPDYLFFASSCYYAQIGTHESFQVVIDDKSVGYASLTDPESCIRKLTTFRGGLVSTGLSRCRLVFHAPHKALPCVKSAKFAVITQLGLQCDSL